MAKGKSAVRPSRDRLKAKARQTAKLAEIRDALLAAGCETTAKQAKALGVGRSTAWALLNHDKRAGPQPSMIKRILASPNLPPPARRKVEEYVEEKTTGLYGHVKATTRRLRSQFHIRTTPKIIPEPSFVPPIGR